MKSNDFRKIERKVQEIEKKSSLENFIVATNFDQNHMMKLGDKFSFSHELQQVYQDLEDLELADLCDFKHGEANGNKF